MSEKRIDRRLEAIADSEVSGPARVRMLTLTLALMTWLAATAVLLFVTDVIGTRKAVRIGVFPGVFAFGAYLVISRAPTIARHVQRLRGATVRLDEGRFVMAFVVTILVTTVVWGVLAYFFGVIILIP